MTEAANAYPAYRDSGVEWLGAVPRHWDVLPARAVYAPKQVKNLGMSRSTVLSLSFGRIVVKPDDKLRGLVPESFETYQHVDPGDIIVRTTDLQNDQRSLRVGIARDRGIITSAYMCLATTNLATPSFGYQLLNTYDLLKIIYGYGSGLRQSLDFGDIKHMPVPVPPLPEQAGIVRFLDYADRRIRRYIAAKRKLIGLLDEQRQAIVQSALTRGLEPSAQMRALRPGWLGDVPVHWEIRRLKTLVSEAVAGPYGSSLTKSMYSRAGYRVYGQQQVIPDDFSVGDYYISPEKYREMAQYRVLPGDVLVSVMGTVGRAAVVPEDVEPGIINPRLVRYHPDESRVRPRYLQAAILSQPSQAQLAEAAKGTTMEGLNMRTLGALLVAVPPLAEQDELLAYLNNQTAALATASAGLTRLVSLLSEYRTRLVADVVTGRFDVRAAASLLREDEPEPSSDEDALLPAFEEAADPGATDGQGDD